MSHLLRSRSALAAAVLALAALAPGCGSEPADFPREPVAGTITLDGRPLDEGLITFTPTDKPEPVVSAVVTDGAFTLGRPDGPAPGPHRVEVWSQKPTGKTVRDPDRAGEKVAEVRSVVPEHYNVNTTLTAEVKPGADNRFEFGLSSARLRTARAPRGRGVKR
ncbi:MAG: hypothetical protein U0835_05170 [Isosphaeraceae bacterium]